MNFSERLQQRLEKSIKDATNEEIYAALLNTVKEAAEERGENTSEKERKIYYISAEFLIGKLLSNNLINLGVYDEVRELLASNGKDICEIEEIEPEPSLGNGGLGRLAACFLDSMATLGINGDGIGLNYHLGLFKQVFEHHKQKETPNPWIQDTGWLTDTGIGFDVPFRNFSIHSKLYDIDVTGYENGTNKLHLFDVDTVNEKIVGDGISFDKNDIKQNLTLFLYPDDSDKQGELLRIYQQYFMVSNGAQYILKEYEEKGYALDELDQHVVIQINDTHPSMVIPELIRLLTAKGISMDRAIEIVSHTCAYTNHTILAEALEKWPVDYLETVVPHLMPIIRELAKRVSEKYADKEVQIIDEWNRVHMARMDMHYGFSVNGVAALHTEILKNVELKPFYDIYPEKFNNKTNGITFRRWLMHCDKKLVDWIDRYGAGEFRKDAAKLEQLLSLSDNEKALQELLDVKQANKTALKEYLEKESGIVLNDHSIFDIQVKRLHEYKRQQMNVLYVIYKYLDIKAGNLPKTPVTVIFGAKAAPAYRIAKDIIHVILCLQELIQNDPEVSSHLQVIMVENYNVTLAEKLIPACDVSEQISLASKEASGTGNMKFMLNGAVTLGTEDGANVEIHELVGDEHIYVFGKSSDEVIEHYAKSDYVAADYYINDADIRRWIDFIISPEMLKIGDVRTLLEIHAELIQKDWFMTLLDVKEYIEVKEKAFADYEDRIRWAKKMLVNIAKVGYFSSDRTIAEYNRDIWKA
ncbi:glycogen/starch/alpha-glucan phosphorylase [Faecalicatena contorta]|uniref:glycogen/starch/alpha-glucan phosphorylase n=1 Tax=Faecalicatena contorta TaxID=39482 RepID=UPI001F33E076|nr:glycogen/starch/alpha-glucan phosphorylase [Faecalicatena contorta]MCF2683898.1 glycogen/starch/alpha-glucan phosphorylase [Faecalicatena contorta]